MRSLILFLTLISSPLGAECLSKYNRSDYPHWGPADNPAYSDIRQQIIAESVVKGLVVKDRRVVAGTYFDRYSGKLREIEDGKIDLEHIISLRWAHGRGANCWPKSLRRKFANDKRHLIPVWSSANRRKSYKVSSYMYANFGYCREHLDIIYIMIKEYPLKPTSQDRKRFKKVKRLCKKYSKGILIKDSWWHLF